MLLAALFLLLAPLPVRAELVEARDPGTATDTRPSTSSGRTAEGDSPIDAERAFAADAQTLGQWTAFAKWSADDAVMFVPQPVNAHAWLKDRKDPVKAVEWWPTASYISCDGSLAVNTGGWKRADGSVGYFSTVWRREKDGGWKWIVDAGDKLSTPRPYRKGVTAQRSACPRMPTFEPPPTAPAATSAFLVSDDGTLDAHWSVDQGNGLHLVASRWNGRKFERVLENEILP